MSTSWYEITYFPVVLITLFARRITPCFLRQRKHWGIENSLHWILDVAFREDESPMRKFNSPENFTMVRHVAFILLKQERTEKVGIQAKRMKAARDRDYVPSPFCLKYDCPISCLTELNFPHAERIITTVSHKCKSFKKLTLFRNPFDAL